MATRPIWMTPEGKGLDHAAVQPHTAGRQARDCESCHQNMADEVRWAFTKWATQNYGERRKPAAEGLRITLETAFACP